MLHKEDKRGFALKEREFGRHGNVQDKIKFFADKHQDMQVEVSVEVDEHVGRLVRCAHVLREDGNRQQVSREVIRTVSKGTQHG